MRVFMVAMMARDLIGSLYLIRIFSEWPIENLLGGGGVLATYSMHESGVQVQASLDHRLLNT
jgi:hypothetical protein